VSDSEERQSVHARLCIHTTAHAHTITATKRRWTKRPTPTHTHSLSLSLTHTHTHSDEEEVDEAVGAERDTNEREGAQVKKLSSARY